jgi:hypothetical protein
MPALLREQPVQAFLQLVAVYQPFKSGWLGVLRRYPSNPSNFDGGSGGWMPLSLSRPDGVKPN